MPPHPLPMSSTVCPGRSSSLAAIWFFLLSCAFSSVSFGVSKYAQLYCMSSSKNNL